MTNLLRLKKSIPGMSRYQDDSFLSLKNELDKLMNNFIEKSHFEPFNFPTDYFENLSVKPAIDIVDDKDRFKVIAEMPGMEEDDITVSIDDDVLTIKGEKSTSKQDENKNYMMREISYGIYERHIALPDSVDIGEAEASFKKGMLWVTLPKKTNHVQQSRSLKIKKAE